LKLAAVATEKLRHHQMLHFVVGCQRWGTSGLARSFGVVPRQVGSLSNINSAITGFIQTLHLKSSVRVE
jgi:hypothetical protein